MTTATETEQALKPEPGLILAKWLSRLEAPGRNQHFGFLRRISSDDDCGGFCAMGELADVLVANGLGQWRRTAYIAPDGTTTLGSVPSTVIAKVFAISENKATYLQNRVVGMNDRGVKFPEIASFVRRCFSPNT